MHSSVTLPSLLILQYLCAQTHTRRTMMKNKSPRQANRKARYAAAHQNWPRPSPAVLCVRSSSLRVRKRCFSASPRSRFRILKVKEPVPVRRTAKKVKGTLLVPGAVTEHAKAKTQETQHQSTKSGAVHTHTHARKQCFNTRKQQHQNSRSTKPPRPLPFSFSTSSSSSLSPSITPLALPFYLFAMYFLGTVGFRSLPPRRHAGRALLPAQHSLPRSPLFPGGGDG